MGGLHMGFGANGGAAAQVLDAIRNTAAQAQHQQQVQQQQSLKDMFEQELKLREKGYTPYMQTTGQDPSGLKRRDAQKVDPNRVIQDPFGRKWVQPAPEAAAPATPQQTFTDTTSLLEKGARPVNESGNVQQMVNTPRVSMPATGPADSSNLQDTGRSGIDAAPPAGTTVRPPGAQQSYYVPPQDETLLSKLRTEAGFKEGTPTVDTEHFSAPVSIDHKTGKVTPLQLPAGVTHNDKAEKGSKYTFSYHTDDHGNVHVLRGDPDSGEVTEVKTIKGAGSARQDDVAERTKERLQDKTEERQQRRVDAAQKQIDTFQTQEQTHHGLRMAYGQALAAQDGEQVIDPKTGRQEMMNKARRAFYKSRLDESTAKVQELQDRQKALVKRMGGDTGEAKKDPLGIR